jgi:hypothetical protein
MLLNFGRLRKPLGRGICILAVIAISAYAFNIYMRDRPRISLNPFCGSTFTYRLNVTVLFKGKPYSSEVVGELLRNRISIGGVCREPVGSILPFRINDDRLLLINAQICPAAVNVFAGGHDGSPYIGGAEGSLADTAFIEAMRNHEKLDIASLCNSISRDKVRRPRVIDDSALPDGFVFDNAENPTRWNAVRFDEADANSESANSPNQLSLVSATAEAANLPARDGLEEIAPEILKTELRFTDWSKGPGWMLFLRRPYGTKDTHVATEQP